MSKNKNKNLLSNTYQWVLSFYFSVIYNLALDV